jgi:hypothetical protein
MKTHSTLTLCILAGLVISATSVGAIDPAAQAKIDARIATIATWAADPVVVEAVRAQNAAAPAEFASVTQEKWAALIVLDPFVRGFTKNAVGQFLKSRKDDAIAEAFVSDAAGRKVGFLAKTSNWTHLGKPKHDVPMTGKVWQGAVEIDASSGYQQLQIAVPVLDEGKPIGSLVVGLSITKLLQ